MPGLELFEGSKSMGDRSSGALMGRESFQNLGKHRLSCQMRAVHPNLCGHLGRERERGEGGDMEAEGGGRAGSAPKPAPALAKEPHSLAHDCRSPDRGPPDSSGLWLPQAQPVTGDPDIMPARELYCPQLAKIQTS